MLIGALAAMLVLTGAGPDDDPVAAAHEEVQTLESSALTMRSTPALPALSGDSGTAERQSPPQGRKRSRFRWRDHPSLDVGKGTYLEFRARVHTHVRRSEAPLSDADESALDFADRRIGIAGEIANIAEFQVERELQDDSDPWRDVFVNLRPFEALQVQGGKFKMPFSHDALTSSTSRDFVHRSLAADQLAPGRDLGVMLHGRAGRRRLRYELGIFDHDGRNARTRDQARVFGNRTVAGRLTVAPFRASKSAVRELQGGIAFTDSDVPLGEAGLHGRTTMSGAFFVPNIWVQGARRRIGVEAQWQPGPFSLKTEYIRITTERRGQGVGDVDLTPFQATGWYVGGTWAATGERKVDGLNAPRRPFLHGGAGALEVAIRVEQLTFGSAATDARASTSPRAEVVAGNADRAITLGVNWYLNRFIKTQANLIRETLADPTTGPLPGKRSFWNSVLRVQFSL